LKNSDFIKILHYIQIITSQTETPTRLKDD